MADKSWTLVEPSLSGLDGMPIRECGQVRLGVEIALGQLPLESGKADTIMVGRAREESAQPGHLER